MEYKFIIIQYSVMGERELNAFASEGWVVVTATPITMDNGSPGANIILGRPWG